MRPSIVLLAVLAASAQASWFGSDKPQYQEWSTADLKAWLNEHQISNPSIDTYSRDELVDLVKSNWNSAAAWSYDQYNAAQHSFANLRESTFETWDESQLRQFLLDQGIVAPKGPKEELLQLVKSRYNQYTAAASSFASRASATASTAVYGDAKYQASQSASSIVAQATATVAHTFDNSKDYVYSTWSDNQLRSYLESKGVLKTKTQKTREELLALMNDSYAKVSNPAWDAWSDSYMREWLASHNIIDDRSALQQNRDALVEQMKQYYYDSNSYVWDTWTDSDLNAWLVDRNIVKSDAQVKREKMVKLVQDNYNNVHDTFWNAWTDNQLRAWLIDNGYLRSDAQVKRDELVKSINDKYTDLSARTAPYLTWPDARLRAFLREHGLSDKQLPTSRPGLLQETRVREIINSGVYAAEEKLYKVWEMLSGSTEDLLNAGKEKAKKSKENAGEGKKWANEKYAQGEKHASETASKLKEEL